MAGPFLRDGVPGGQILAPLASALRRDAHFQDLRLVQDRGGPGHPDLIPDLL